MERFASAYGRALFPARYGSRSGVSTNGETADSSQPRALAPGSLELAMGAGIYHAVVAVEGWLEGLRRQLAAWRSRPQRGSGATPVGCG